jgi:outer membrane protein assembly factor BamB
MIRNGIIGVDAADGTILWQHTHITRTINDPVHPNPPVHEGNLIVISSGYGAGTVGLELSEDGASVSRLWSSKAMSPTHGGVTSLDGRVYGTPDLANGGFICLDMRTGDLIHRGRGVGRGSAIHADGMFYCLSERGRIGLIDPETGDVVSQFKCPGVLGKAWAHPTISGGRLYIRHADSVHVFDISAKSRRRGA